MPTPTVNVQNGQITNGPLVPGQLFQWYNPSNVAVTLTNCGNFCTHDSYTVAAASYQSAAMLANPNTNSMAFTDPAWNTPGQPHIQAPSKPEDVEGDETAEQEVA